MAASTPRMVYDDVYELCRSKTELLIWLNEKQLIKNFRGPCDKCTAGELHCVKDISYKSDQLVFRCTNRTCNFKKSIRHRSWFQGSHLSLETILKLTYYWVYKLPLEFVQTELKIGSCGTVVDWYNFAREVCLQISIQDNEQIGGENIVVEIDESKFG